MKDWWTTHNAILYESLVIETNAPSLVEGFRTILNAIPFGRPLIKDLWMPLNVIIYGRPLIKDVWTTLYALLNHG